MMSPVLSTPRRARSLGIAKPVQPSSSKMGTVSPPASPSTSGANLSVDVTMSGMYSADVSDRTKRVAELTSGAVRSATAYQRVPTRQRRTRDHRSRNPALPSTKAIKRMPATLGPDSDEKPTSTKFGLDPVVLKKPPGPTIRRIASVVLGWLRPRLGSDSH